MLLTSEKVVSDACACGSRGCALARCAKFGEVHTHVSNQIAQAVAFAIIITVAVIFVDPKM